MDILDTTFLDELNMVMGEDLKNLFNAFFADTEAQFDSLVSAVDNGDGESLRKSAHTLKGAAASVAAQALSQQFHQLECCGRDGKFEQAAVAVDEARTMFFRTRDALQQWQQATFA